MKNLIKIVLSGTLVFMAISMIQQWEAFVGGAAEGEIPAASRAAAEAEAAQAVRSFISLSRHLYAGGDRRFAERLPATEEVTAEILADVAYLRQNRRIQRARLMGLQLLDVRLVVPGRAEVRTKEYWVTRIEDHASGRLTDPVRSEVVYAIYRVSRQSGGWRVVAWDPEDPPAPGPEPGAGEVRP